MTGLKHLYLILIGTFVVGFVAGVYVHFMTQSEAPRSDGEYGTRSEGVVLTADEYGGCESMGCRSYRITEDGEYTFIEGSRTGADRRFEGTLGRRELDRLLGQLDEQELQRVESSVFTGTCPIAFDGPAYRLQVQVEDEQYAFDTCEQDIASSPFLTDLLEYFEIFSTNHTSP